MVAHIYRREAKVARRALQSGLTVHRPQHRDIRRIAKTNHSKSFGLQRTSYKDPYKKHSSIFKRTARSAANRSRELDLDTHEDIAAKYAMFLFSAKEAVGEREYPHEFKNYGGLPLRHRGPYYEFPLLRNGQLYQGENPGPTRIVFTPDGVVANIIRHCRYMPA